MRQFDRILRIAAILGAIVAGFGILFLLAENWAATIPFAGDAEFRFHNMHPIRYVVLVTSIWIGAALAVAGLVRRSFRASRRS